MVVVGVIGFSRRSKKLIEVLLQHDEVEVRLVYEEHLGLCDANRDYKIPLTNSYDEFWGHDYDLVVIGSSNWTHEQHILKCFDENVNIFCEKPIIKDIDQYRSVMARAKDYPKLFATGFVLRHSPVFTACLI